MKGAWGLVMLAGLAGGLPATARALEPEARVRVSAVELRGDMPSDVAARVRAHVAEELAGEGIAVVVEGLDGCDEADCSRAAAEASADDYWVEGRVDGEEDEYTVTLVLHSARADEPPQPFARSCSICGLVEVQDMARMQALDVRAEIVRRRAARRPSVSSPPPRSLEERARSSKLMLAGWALAGAGAATTVGGTVLLALHRRSAGCLDAPGGGDCVSIRFSTAPAGAAVLGFGVVLAGAAAIVIVNRRKAEAKPRRVSLGPAELAVRF